MNGNSGGASNPFNPVQPETPESPEMMAWPGSRPGYAQGAAQGTSMTGQAARSSATNPFLASAQPGAAGQGATQPGQSMSQAMAQALAQPANDPMSEPKGSMVQPAKSKKTGLIVALVVLLIVALGGAGAAVAILNPFGWGKSSDRVTAAITNLLSDNGPRKFSLKGSVMLAPQNSSSFGNTLIAFDSGIDIQNNTNFVNAKIKTIVAETGGVLEFGVEEIHAASGDLYVRLTGLSEMIRNYAATLADDDDDNADADTDGGQDKCLDDVTECVDVADDEADDDMMTNCIGSQDMNCDPAGDYVTDCASDFSGEADCIQMQEPDDPLLLYAEMGIFDALDNEWIRISADVSDDALGMLSLNLDSSVVCWAESIGYLNTLGKIYEANPFITSTTIDNKRDDTNQWYRLGIDEEKFASFNTAFHNSDFMNSVYSSCLDNTSDSDYELGNDYLPATQQAYFVTGIEEAYATIDGNDNITQLTFTTKSDTTPMAVDVEIGYPGTVTIDEPNSYVNIEELLQDLFMQIFGGLDFNFDYDADFDFDSDDWDWD